MVGFIGFIIVMAVLGNILEALDSAQFQLFLAVMLAVLGSYRFTKRNLGRWKQVKDQQKLEEEKDRLRKEIEEEKEKIASIQEIQPETIDEPYYPEVRYFNR